MTQSKTPIKKLVYILFNFVADSIKGSKNEIEILDDLDSRLKTINQILLGNKSAKEKVNDVAILIEPAFNFILKVTKSDLFLKHQLEIYPIKGVKKAYSNSHSSLEIILTDEDLIRFVKRNSAILLTKSDAVNAIQDFIKEKDEIFGIKKQVNSQEKKGVSKSYKWLKAKYLYQGLYKVLRDEEKLISKETKYKQFENVFDSQPIGSFVPIKWHDENASEVLFFIMKMAEYNLIENKPRIDYLKLKACFVRPNGQPFEQSFKDLKKNISITLSENKQKVIESILLKFN